MATITKHQIGTGQVGGFSLPQTWEDQIPLDVAASGAIHRGALMKGEIVSSSRLLSISSDHITNAECYIHFTAEDGHSFMDDPGLATNPVRYDASKGAALRFTGDTHSTVTIAAAHTKVDRLQLSNTATSSLAGGAINVFGTAATFVDINQCICESSSKNTSIGTVLVRNSTSKVRNTLALLKGVTVAGACAMSLIEGAQAINCVAFNVDSTANYALVMSATGGQVKNCYVGGGALGPHNGGWSAAAFTACFADVAAGGCAAAPAAGAFNSIAMATLDFRTPVSSPLRDSGVVDNAFAAFDILGRPRPQNGVNDVGVWEAPVTDTTAPTVSTPTAAATGSTTYQGSVSTNEAGGALRYLASINSVETVPTVTTNGASQMVAAIGVQNVTGAGLAPATSFYLHFVHVDNVGLVSNRVTAGPFTTPAAGDTTKPVLTEPLFDETGSNSAAGSVITSEAGGLLYRYASTNIVEQGPTVVAANKTQQVSAAGIQYVTLTGLPEGTDMFVHLVHIDASGNVSDVSTSAQITTFPTQSAGTLTTKPYMNGAEQVLAGLQNLSVAVLTLPYLGHVGSVSGEDTGVDGRNSVTMSGIVKGVPYIHVSTDGITVGAEIIVAS